MPQWLAAAGTLAAVLVALFKDELLRYFRQPKLSVRIESQPPDCLLSPINVLENNAIVWSGDCYWLRLWIGNNGSSRAEQVQVFASKLWKRNASNEMIEVTAFVPMNLRWSNSRDWRNPEIFAPGIARQMGKNCDLCSVCDPANPRDELQGFRGRCIATLQLEVFPSADKHRLPPGNYVIELIVGAANANPVKAYVALNLTGNWSSDQAAMFRDHLGVKMIASPTS